MDFVDKIKNLSDPDLFKKARIHRNSNVFLVILWIILFLTLFIDSKLEKCIPTIYSNGDIGCSYTVPSMIIGFIVAIIFFPSTIEGINGLKLSKVAEEKLKEKNFTLLKITSYILLLPALMLVVLFFVNMIKS